jgi:hypothetical protein
MTENPVIGLGMVKYPVTGGGQVAEIKNQTGRNG